MEHSRLAGFFEAMLSVEEVGLYKPHAHVYRWAARKLGVGVAECLLVAAHGWDVAGASWAGMRTAFVARPGQQVSRSAHRSTSRYRRWSNCRNSLLHVEGFGHAVDHSIVSRQRLAERLLTGI